MRRARAAYAGFVLVCAAALIWPVYPWLGARVAPRVLGLPFSLVYLVGWVVASFLALLAYHVATGGERER